MNASNRHKLTTTSPSAQEACTKRARIGFQLRQLTSHNESLFHDEIHQAILLCPVSKVFIDTPQFQRLKNIKQLGVTDKVNPKANHSRFEHSIGVAHLAEQMCQAIQQHQPHLNCQPKDILCVKLAGLLHDCGHGCFSHIYEQFLHALPASIEAANPDIQERYKNWPDIPQGWEHEEASLMMIDALLEHLGLAIDTSVDNLDKPLRQIGDGIDARSLEVFGNGSEASPSTLLTSRDFVFIKECIYGGPLPNSSHQNLLGRPHWQDEWLYDIVSNRYSGLDVDKIEYFSRDSRRFSAMSGHVDLDMIENAVVAWSNCLDSSKCPRCTKAGHPNRGKHLMICYPESLVPSAINFFRRRFMLHSDAYREIQSSAASVMMCDILCQADPFLSLPTSSGTSVPISRAMTDQQAYFCLTDNILDQLLESNSKDLEPAKSLYQRYQKGDIYKCAGEWILNTDSSDEQELWKISEKDIVKELSTMADSSSLSISDIAIEYCRIHHGKKHNHPVGSMRFLSGPQMLQCQNHNNKVECLPQAQPAELVRYAAHLPQANEQKSLRVFSRSSNDDVLVLLTDTFARWKAAKLQEWSSPTSYAHMFTEVAISSSQLSHDTMLRVVSQEEEEDFHCDSHTHHDEDAFQDQDMAGLVHPNSLQSSY